MRWLFEDRLTIQYQVQEMLRTERIFEAEGIAEELAAYNPLIPDGGNWKATLLIEYPDPEQRRVELGRLKGVEDGLLGRGFRGHRGCLRSPMRISSARTPRKPRPCTFCASR